MNKRYNLKTTDANINGYLDIEFEYYNGATVFKSISYHLRDSTGEGVRISGTGLFMLKVGEASVYSTAITSIDINITNSYDFADTSVSVESATIAPLTFEMSFTSVVGDSLGVTVSDRIALLPYAPSITYSPQFDTPFYAYITAPSGVWINYSFTAYNMGGGVAKYKQSGRREEYEGGTQPIEFSIPFDTGIGIAENYQPAIDTSITADIYCQDSNGALRAVTVYVSERLYFPIEKVAPKVILSVDITNPFEDICVQGYSGLKVTVSGEETYSSPIKGYSLYINDRIYPLTDGVWQSDVIRLYGTLNIKAEAINTRLVKGETKVEQEVYEYSTPTLAPVTGKTSVVARRANDEGAEDDGGGNLYIGAVASFKSLNGKNVCKLTYRLAPTGETLPEWTEADGTEINGIVQAIEPAKGYVVEVGVSDSLTTEKYILSFAIPTAEIFMIASAKNNAMYLGYYGTEKNVVSVGGNLTMLSNGVYHQIVKSQNGTITIENLAERDYALVFGVGVLGLITLAAGEISWQGTNGITLSYENGTVTVSGLMSEDNYTIIRRKS